MEKRNQQIQIITEALVKKISNNIDPLKIITLNFHARSSTLERIEKIEGLENLINLEELNLSYNMISRIENLTNLQKLRDLNLADNNIRRIENLESLPSLEVLNLNGNLISEIPQVKTKYSRYNIQCKKMKGYSRTFKFKNTENIEK